MRTIGCTLILSLLVSACATTTGYEQQRYEPPPTVREVHQKACDELARAEAAKVKGEPLGDAFGRGVLFGAGTLLGLAFFGAGFVVLGAISAGWQAAENAEMRQAAYDGALEACLKAVILEETLGPEHPDVAESLHYLANRYALLEKYAEAEPLYKRALAIQEKALDTDDPRVARTLQEYANLLRKTDRQTEAEEMEARAKAIPTKQPEPAPEQAPENDGIDPNQLGP